MCLRPGTGANKLAPVSTRDPRPTISTSPDEVVRSSRGTVTLAELRALCDVVEPGIVRFREHPDANVEVFTTLVRIAAELGEPFGDFAVIVDLRAAQNRPGPDMVQAISKSVRSVGIHWATVQSGNLAIRTIAKFVMTRLAGPGVSIHANLDDAIAACREALARGRRRDPHDAGDERR